MTVHAIAMQQHRFDSMSGSNTPERLAKRARYAHHQSDTQQHSHDHIVELPTSINVMVPESSLAYDSHHLPTPWTPEAVRIDPSWPSMPALTPGPGARFPELVYGPRSVAASDTSLSTSLGGAEELTSWIPVSAVAAQPHSQSQLLQNYNNHPLQLDTSAASATSPESLPHPVPDLKRRKSDSDPSLMNPFTDCENTFGVQPRPLYLRPQTGLVNSYVKFHWIGGLSMNFPDTGSSDLGRKRIRESAEASGSRVRGAVPVLIRRSRAAVSGRMIMGPALPNHLAVTSSTTPSIHSHGSTLLVSAASPNSAAYTPQLLPQQFGLHARMDKIDRKLWDFCTHADMEVLDVNNWCPGRSILQATNFWHKDFAKMHSVPAVLAAIQCLAGVYIYDYFPLEAIRQRVNDNFAAAMKRLTELLASPEFEHGDEVITLSVLLSMQDIILTERRVKKPDPPRWLLGFQHGEHFLQKTDQGSRFWKMDNVQLGSLRNSHCVVIGRHIILTQSLTALPSPAEFDPQYESARFDWLLYGSKAETYEIHGGCGFSKRLLHLVGQITYCAARLQQQEDSIVVPVTAKFLYKELREMRQWSPEIGTWEDAFDGRSPLELVRSMPPGFIIRHSAQMTAITAEAWRIAAMLYLQCRLLRLPRHDPAVVANLDDLAQCIRVMPTSGSIFTAQAPLFPVFLLGLLATVPKHKKVSVAWFDQVVQAPVRSSVPPLYGSLKKIWTWLDSEFPISTTGLSKEKANPADHPGQRPPWWEHLITRIREKEDEETLCLT
ncbi:hypothetical protein S7711_06055 [Stachybotrys chartarum IBT 7711]|uniref:Transcription factor domain-containing protein n=1 Tax=Stachybotrys chartarum (strain CBS 109288 / IBT 7711) TaxID=1280523 RepID=A0A084B215_STACB|nr:hypothetical protein S7711_06055 [Stachybotrys chartarum IBT 7711]